MLPAIIKIPNISVNIFTQFRPLIKYDPTPIKRANLLTRSLLDRRPKGRERRAREARREDRTREDRGSKRSNNYHDRLYATNLRTGLSRKPTSSFNPLNIVIINYYSIVINI